jgi:3-oxoacyl-[acyl-carrier-protein] synthase III
MDTLSGAGQSGGAKLSDEHGNCSSTTVLLMLERQLREGRAKPGEWGMMMPFGPGLTLGTCLLQF